MFFWGVFLGGEVKEYIFVAIKDIMFVYYLILLLGKFDSRVLVHSPFSAFYRIAANL